MKDTIEIYQEMKEEIERRTGVFLNSGGDMALRLYAVAAELETLWAQVQWTKNQCFPQTASGDCLELHALARGLERSSSTAATGHIRFEIESVRNDDLIIDTGTVCLNAAGLEFVTSDTAVISAGDLYCIAPAVARRTGTSGNVPAHSITYMALAPVGVIKCYNPNAFAGGADDESDESLRKRIIESYASLPNGSNKAYYKSVAMDTEGVAAVSVVPRARGLGTVDIVISTPSGIPDSSLLNSVRDKFEKQREICVDVHVLGPQTVTVPVSVAIEVKDGQDFNIVATKVSNAIHNYFDGKLLGQDILLAKLGFLIFSIEGVSNYSITQPSSDILIKYNELPVIGSVSITRR